MFDLTFPFKSPIILKHPLVSFSINLTRSPINLITTSTEWVTWRLVHVVAYKINTANTNSIWYGLSFQSQFSFNCFLSFSVSSFLWLEINTSSKTRSRERSDAEMLIVHKAILQNLFEAELLCLDSSNLHGGCLRP